MINLTQTNFVLFFFIIFVTGGMVALCVSWFAAQSDARRIKELREEIKELRRWLMISTRDRC